MAVRGNARVNAGSLKATAQNTSDTRVEDHLAAGGLGAGLGTLAQESHVTPSALASIDGDAPHIYYRLAATRRLQAASRPAPPPSPRASAWSIGGAAIGVVTTDGNVTPTVDSHVGDNATIVAGGKVEVLADILAKTVTSGTVLDDFFQPSAGDVSTADDTIHFDAHGLEARRRHRRL